MLTTEQKLRAIIRKDVVSGFEYTMKADLMRLPQWAARIEQRPEVFEELKEWLVDQQMVYYRTASKEAIDQAYEFFVVSPAGDEWVGLAARFRPALHDIGERATKRLLEKLSGMQPHV